MKADLLSLAEAWARELPRPFVERLAAALRDGDDALRALEIAAVLPASRAAVDQAKVLAGAGDGLYVAGALDAFVRARAEETTLVPVWTGPEPDTGSSGRLTLAVLADLVAEADREIVLVSYATLPGPALHGALANAVRRGVVVRTLLERRADNPHFFGDDTSLSDIPIDRLCWPGALRPVGASMHAKVLVVDRTVALVGSANLTGPGLERNLECGMLVRGGPVPALIAAHFDALAADGVLLAVS